MNAASENNFVEREPVFIAGRSESFDRKEHVGKVREILPDGIQKLPIEMQRGKDHMLHELDKRTCYRKRYSRTLHKEIAKSK